MSDLAKLAYEAYGLTTGNKNFRGEEMPKFEDLPATIKLAWSNAARAVKHESHIISITADNGDTIILVAPSEDFDLDELTKNFVTKENETVHLENIRFKEFLLANGFEDLKIVDHKHPLD